MQISKEAMESMTCSQRKMISERFKPGASILSKPAKTSIEKGLKAMGMTQEKIAQKVGVASSTLSRYKLHKGDGKRRPSFKSLSRLSKATGRSPEQLFPELA